MASEFAKSDLLPTMPKAIWSGEFTLFGVTLHCHVLDTGERVIEADDVVGFFEALSHTEYDEATMTAELVAFARWQHGVDQP